MFIYSVIPVIGIVGWRICNFAHNIFFLYVCDTTAKDISIDVSKMLLLLIFNRHCIKCFSLKGMLTLLLEIVMGYHSHTIKLLHYRRKVSWTDRKLFLTAFVSLMYPHSLNPSCKLKHRIRNESMVQASAVPALV